MKLNSKNKKVQINYPICFEFIRHSNQNIILIFLMISNYNRGPPGAADYLQSNHGGLHAAGAMNQRDPRAWGGHPQMQGAAQQQQAHYLNNMPTIQQNQHSRAQIHQPAMGYHQQSDELNLNDSRPHMQSMNYQPQYQQQTFSNSAGFGGISQLDNADGRAAPGSQANAPSDAGYRSKFARGINQAQSMQNNENQNQMNQEYMRRMERLDSGINHFKKDYEIQMKERAAMDRANNHYDNAQDFLGESNISAINPAPSDINIRQSQQSLPNQPESVDKYSNFAERFAAIDQMSPAKMLRGSVQDPASLPTQESNMPYTYQTAQFSQGFSHMQHHALKELTQSQRSSKELLTITIEIGNGQNENIHINEGDSPHRLAADFARRHGINEQLTELLAEQIRLNIEQLAESKENSMRQSAVPDNDTFGRQTQHGEGRSQATGGDPNDARDRHLSQPQIYQQNANGEAPNQLGDAEGTGQHSGAATTKPPTYDERQDEVASVGSLLSGATSKAKRNTGHANEGIVSTAVEEANSGSTRLQSIASHNHGVSNQHVSTYLNSVEAMYDKRTSAPAMAQQAQYQQHMNMPPLYPLQQQQPPNGQRPKLAGSSSHPHSNLMINDQPSQRASGVLDPSTVNTQLNIQTTTASALGVELKENARDAISINDEGTNQQQYALSPPMLSSLDQLTHQQQQYQLGEMAGGANEAPAHHGQEQPAHYFSGQMNQSSASLNQQPTVNNVIEYSHPMDNNVPMSLQSDRGDTMNTFYNQPAGSVSNSFKNFDVRDHMGIGVGAKNLIDPNSQTYLNWYRGLNKKLEKNKQSMHEPKDVLQKPKISMRSQQIIEQKRYGSSKGSRSGSNFQTYNVHQRLHQQAMAKQRALRTVDSLNDSQDTGSAAGRGSRWRSLPRGGGSRGSANDFSEKIHYASSNNLMPRGQYKIMQDNQRQYGARLRSASVQGSATLPGGDKRYCNTTQKNNFSEGMSSQGENSAGRRNYGELLYQRGMRRKEEIKKLIKRARSEHDKQELEELTFQPKINPISKNMTRMNNERAEDFLIKYGKAVKEKVDSQRVDKLRAETQGLTFQPKVSKVSERIVLQKKAGQSDHQFSKFDSLYQDARRRQERQEFIYSACIESECTFQPDTEKTKYFNAQATSSLKSSSGAKHVFQRLSHRMNSSQDRKRMYMENSRSLNNELFDPETGQTLFQPKVGRGPRGRSRSKDANDQLYRQGQISRDKKLSVQRQHHENIRRQAEHNFSKPKTNKIVEKQKSMNFSKIFDSLDSDNDGQISAYRIDISSLEPDLLQVLTPLFVEMEELGMNLDREEFIDAATRLYESVSLPEKNILVNRRSGNRSNSARARSSTYGDSAASQALFKPRLNANSLKMAEKINNSGHNGQAKVADRLLDKKREYDRKNKERKSEQQNMELLGCTFHPKVMASPQGSVSSTNRKNSALRSIGTKSPDLSTANVTHGGIDVNQLAKQVVQDLFKNQRKHNDPYLMPSMSHEQPIQEGTLSRPPLYQNQALKQPQFNIKSHQVSMEQVQSKEHANLAMLQQPLGSTDSNMIPRQIIGLPAEAGGTFLDLPRKSPNAAAISHNNSQSQPEIQNQIHAQNQLLYVNNNPSQDTGMLQHKMQASKKMHFDKSYMDDNTQKTKNSLENNSQVSTNQLQDELASASTGPGNLLNFQAQATASINQLLRDSYTLGGSNQMITTNMTTNTFTQRQNPGLHSVGAAKTGGSQASTSQQSANVLSSIPQNYRIANAEPGHGHDSKAKRGDAGNPKYLLPAQMRDPADRQQRR